MTNKCGKKKFSKREKRAVELNKQGIKFSYNLTTG